MKPAYHLVLGTVAAAALVPVLGAGSVAFGAASVLLDADHYADYLYRNRLSDFSLRRAVRFNQLLFDKAKAGPFLSVDVFHTVEALALAGVVALWAGPLLIAAFWGMLFHVALDLVDLRRHGLLTKRAHSIVEYMIRWNLRNRRGEDLEAPYRAACRAVMGAAAPGRKGSAE